MELSKQTDAITHLATANLIDELSLGVAIMSEEGRVIAELEQFVTQPTPGGATTTLQNRVSTHKTRLNLAPDLKKIDAGLPPPLK